MTTSRCDVLRLFLGAMVLGNWLAADLHAQAYPSRPIRLLVGFAAGGSTDTTARILARQLSDRFGQAVIVENRTGAAGSIATERVAKSHPDGYTLLFMPATGAIEPALRSNLPYDLERDFAPVSLVAAGPYLVTVHPSVPVRDVTALIALARSQPGKLSYGSAGVGSTIHLAAELFNAMARVKTLHVPYKGGSEAVIAVAAGQVGMGFVSIPAAMSLLTLEKLRALAVTSAKRSSLMPSLPSLHESGLAGYDRPGWYGVLAPSGVPNNVMSQLVSSIARAATSVEMKDSLEKQGFEPRTSTPEEFRAFFRHEVAENQAHQADRIAAALTHCTGAGLKGCVRITDTTAQPSVARCHSSLSCWQ